MLHRCSNPEQTNLLRAPSAFHIFTSNIMNLKGSIIRRMEKKELRNRLKKIEEKSVFSVVGYA